MIRVFSHWLPANTVLRMTFDLALLFLSVILAVAWLDRGELDSVAKAAPYALLFALAMMAVNALLGVYRSNPGQSTAGISRRVILCFVLAAPMAHGVSSLVPRPEHWRLELELVVLLAFGLMVAMRAYAGRRGQGSAWSRRVMVLGTGIEADGVRQSLARSEPDVRIVTFPPLSPDTATHVARDGILSDGASLTDATRRLKVDEIIVAVHERRGGTLPLRGLLECKLAGVQVLDLSSYFERTLGQVRLESLRASWLIFGDGFRQGLLRTAVKRVFDVVATLVLLTLFWPLMLVSAMLIALESGFPILYFQERVGRGGRLFRVVKFRSMRNDAEHDGQPRWAASNDDRVTRVGRVLRRLRIDELPQIFNVMKGDMSLVGPRPERPYFVDKLTCEIPFYAARHSVKPGVTGWAQVRYHYGDSVDDAVQKLQYDLYYVKNHTLFLDTVILFETVGVVLSGASAH